MKPTAEDALASIEERLRGMVLKRYFAPGMTVDDLLQEARIGAYRGWETWKPDGGRKLQTFMIFTAERLVQTTVLQARRRQNRGGDEVWLDSLDREVREESDATTLGELIESGQTLEEIVCDREDLRRHLDRLGERAYDHDGKTLTELEAAAVIGPAIGVTYAAVGEAFDKNPKAVDNARQRGLAKLGREPEAIGRPRPRPRRPSTFRHPRCLGSNLPTTEPEEDAMPETAANPIVEATQAQIDATVAWRDEAVAKVDAVAGEQLERLREILEKAEALPTANGNGEMHAPQLQVDTGKAERTIRRTREHLAQTGTAEKVKTKVRSKATTVDARDKSERAAEWRRRELQIRKALEDAGPDGLGSRELKEMLDMPEDAKRTLLRDMQAQGTVRKTGATRSIRYYLNTGREPETEESQAAS